MGHRQRPLPHPPPPGRRRPIQRPPTVEERPPIGGQPKAPRPVRRGEPRSIPEPREIRVNESAQGKGIPVTLGKTEDGVRWTFLQTYANGLRLFAIANHGHGPIQAATPYLDGTAMTWDGANNRWTANGGLALAWFFDGNQVALTGTGLLLSSYDAAAAAEEIHTGYAYTVFQFTYHEENNTTLPKISFIVEGFDEVYDPRTLGVGYSENFALFTRELLTNPDWGFGYDAADLDEQSFEDGADYCDEQVHPAKPTVAITAADGGAGALTGNYDWVWTAANTNGVETLPAPVSNILSITGKKAALTVPLGDSATVKRFIYRKVSGAYYRTVTLNDNTTGSAEDNVTDATALTGAPVPTVAPLSTKRWYGGLTLWVNSSDADAALRLICKHFGGHVKLIAGKWTLLLDKALPGGYVPKEFSVAAETIDEASVQLWRKDRSELFNEVRLWFSDANNRYEKAEILKQRATVIAGTESPRTLDVQMFAYHDSGVAGRMATELLNRAWDDLGIEFDSDPTGLEVLPNDVIAVTAAGLSSQRFRVDRVETQDGRPKITGFEYQAASYSGVIQEADSPVVWGGIPVADAYADPPPVTGLTVAENDPGVITLEWTAPDFGLLAGYHITMSIDAGPTIDLGMFYSTHAEIPITTFGNYSFSVYVVSTTGRQSVATTDTIDNVPTAAVPIPEAVPSNVGHIYASLSDGGLVTLTWDPVTNIARELYEIRRGSQTDSWATSVELVGRYGSRQALDFPPFGNWRYLIKAVNAEGVYSATAAQTDVSVANYFQNPTTADHTPVVRVEGTHPEVVVNPVNAASVALAETVIVTDGLSTERVRILLARKLTSSQINTEITANGNANITAWDAWDLSTRKINAAVGLWGPLMPVATDIWFGYASLESEGSGTIFRNIESRLTSSNGSLIGVSESPDDFAALAVGHEQVNNDPKSVLWGPKVYFGKDGGRICPAFRLVANSPRLQRILGESLTSTVVASEVQMRHQVPIGVFDVTTNATGDATITFPTSMGLSQTPIAHAIVTTTSPINIYVRIISVSATAVVVKTHTESGTNSASRNVRVYVYDAGDGGTFVA